MTLASIPFAPSIRRGPAIFAGAGNARKCRPIPTNEYRAP